MHQSSYDLSKGWQLRLTLRNMFYPNLRKCNTVNAWIGESCSSAVWVRLFTRGHIRWPSNQSLPGVQGLGETLIHYCKMKSGSDFFSLNKIKGRGKNQRNFCRFCHPTFQVALGTTHRSLLLDRWGATLFYLLIFWLFISRVPFWSADFLIWKVLFLS